MCFDSVNSIAGRYVGSAVPIISLRKILCGGCSACFVMHSYCFLSSQSTLSQNRYRPSPLTQARTTKQNRQNSFYQMEIIHPADDFACISASMFHPLYSIGCLGHALFGPPCLMHFTGLSSCRCVAESGPPILIGNILNLCISNFDPQSSRYVGC